MRLNISWVLDQEEPEWDLWKNKADTLRLDTNINNDGYVCGIYSLNNSQTHTHHGASTFTSFAAVQRIIESYRVFITQQTLDPTRQTTPIAIRPDMDMDNTYIGNPQSLSGLSAVQR